MLLNTIIKFFLENKLVTALMILLFVGWGLVTAPFGWDIKHIPTDSVPVDAIPDIGENQQIVFTEWMGRSPQDVEDQITYPLTTSLLGLPGVKSIRSTSMFGFSSIYIIFDEDKEFYWTRTRILEKLNSLSSGILPEGVQPTLGPDATALGQVYWYTIEGRDEEGNPTGGWDLHEIRTVQDFYVKYGLNAVEGVSEVASIGGFVKEYQIDVNPDALRAYDIPLTKVIQAIRQSNRDVGAKTIEVNQVEYLVRGLGYIQNIEDIEKAVVTVQDNTPIRVQDIATVTIGPETRRGMLDKGGAEVAGGVVVARYGSNPLEVINNVKEKIDEISHGLPSKTLANGKKSQLTIVPFYDRTELIYETIGTLEEALSLQILITILVIIVMIYNLRASLLISILLPLAVLMVFIAMRYLNVDANIVALSGIAISIGTMVDLGVILSENIIKKIKEKKETTTAQDDSDEETYQENLKSSVYEGSTEVASAILTAVSTTIVSFIPVFTLQQAEGKLFGPLAFTKTFALIAALLVTLLILPTLAQWFLGIRVKSKGFKKFASLGLILIGITGLFFGIVWGSVMLLLFGVIGLLKQSVDHTKLPWLPGKLVQYGELFIAVFGVIWLLAVYWLPLGPSKSLIYNFIFVSLITGVVLGVFTLLESRYKQILQWCLDNKFKFLLLPFIFILLGLNIWLGFNTVFGFIPKGLDKAGIEIKKSTVWSSLSDAFPGMGKEFMPALDEGSFLLMPTSMPHSGVEYNRKVTGQLDMLVNNIPEVEMVVGKMGRAETALDPAPISMFENIINYKPEYITDERGRRIRFKTNKNDHFILEGLSVKNDQIIQEENSEIGFDNHSFLFVNPQGEEFSEEVQDKLHQSVSNSLEKHLVRDNNGTYFRNWREHIHSPNDIWDEIVRVIKIPGITSAPKLQPIETRLVMLQTGMRAPMGIKVFGPDLESIEAFGMKLEEILKNVPSVKEEAVFADRVIGKPYIHIDIIRDEISRHGLTIEDVQQIIETAIGGNTITTTVEGRDRYPVRVRYPRELRDSPEMLSNILIPTPSGAHIPLGQVADINYEPGPQMIKSEETFLVSYVLFDRLDEFSEVEVVNDAQEAINHEIENGSLNVPPGINWKFSGNYENQVRSEERLALIVPIVLAVIFLILYFQFKSVRTSLMVFLGIMMAFSGGFIMLWLYGQSWFGDFSLFGTNFRDLFQIGTVNLSVAVWVGFIALFGIATDDGVIMATYLDQSFKRNKTTDVKSVREAVIEGGQKRIKPAVMTSATTIIALLPILSSTGRGADVMIPMAIPAFGGMIMAVITYFIIPVLYSMKEERKLKSKS